MSILDIRDKIASTKDLVGCLYLACRGLQSPDERASLCAVSYSVRTELLAIDEALQDLIGSADIDAGWRSDGS